MRESKWSIPFTLVRRERAAPVTPSVKRLDVATASRLNKASMGAVLLYPALIAVLDHAQPLIDIVPESRQTVARSSWMPRHRRHLFGGYARDGEPGTFKYRAAAPRMHRRAHDRDLMSARTQELRNSL